MTTGPRVAKRAPHGAGDRVLGETYRMARSIVPSFIAALVFASLVHACTSSSGQTCRKPSDCDTGLVCCNGGAVTTGGARGVCQPLCSIVVVDSGVDAGTDASATDASTTDASADAGGD